MTPMEPENEFRLCHTQTVNGTQVSEYISDQCGVRVFLAETERPLLDAIFLVPTEASNNLGCPHALEHLVFFGSQNYPYKGVLDAAANKCLSEGTNAWTAADHTAYTLTTAGYSGFMNLLEVYLDHIIHPLITEDAFLTEVYSIGLDGSDEGVVYSEMEDQEYRCSNMVDYAARTQLYPEPCGYRYDSGGRLDGVRNVTHQQIVDYHRAFYRWDNLSLILVGRLPVDAFLSKLSAYLRKEGATRSREFTAPWSRPIPLPKTFKKLTTVEFPSSQSHDDLCEVTFNWRGPSWTSFTERFVLEVLGHYLVSTASSPLKKRFVHAAHPYCSDVSFDEEPFKETSYCLRFFDIYRKRISRIGTLLRQTLQDLYTEGLDLQRIKSTIERLLALFEQNLEESPEQGFGELLVEYAVHSPAPDSALLTKLWAVEDTLQEFLMNQPQEFWNAKLKHYFLDASCLEVRGVPSLTLSKTLEKQKLQRIKKQKEFIGQTCTEHAKRLEEAKKRNEVHTPPAVLESIPVSRISDVQTFTFPSYKNFRDPEPLSFSDVRRETSACASSTAVDVQRLLNSLPYAVYFCDTPSQFIEARLSVRLPLEPSASTVESREVLPPSSVSLTNEEIMLLPLLSELLFQCNAKSTFLSKARLAGGNDLPACLDHETFSDVLLEHLVEHQAYLGVLGESAGASAFPELFTLYFSARKNKVVELGELLLTVLHGAVFTEDRVASLSKAGLVVLLRRKRRAKIIGRSVHLALRYDRNNIRCLTDTACQQQLLRSVARNPAAYTEKLQDVYHKLFSSVAHCKEHKAPPVVLQLIGSRETLLRDNSFHTVLRSLLPTSTATAAHQDHTLKDILRLPSTRSQRRAEKSPLPYGNAVILESSTTEGDTLTLSWLGAHHEPHPDAANLLTLCELFSGCDGPLFNAVRGSGSAYTAVLSNSIASGELFLHLRSCVDVVTAFTVSIELFKECLRDPAPSIAPHTESAKCTALFQLIRAEATASDYATERLHNLCLGLPEIYSQYMIQQVDNVTFATLADTVNCYFSRLMPFCVSPESYAEEKSLVVVTGAEKAQTVLKALEDAQENGLGQFLTGTLQQCTWDSLVAWLVTGDPLACDTVKLTQQEVHLEGEAAEDSFEESCSSDEEQHVVGSGKKRGGSSRRRIMAAERFSYPANALELQFPREDDALLLCSACGTDSSEAERAAVDFYAPLFTFLMEEYHRFRREKKRFGVTSDGAFVVGISAPQGFGKTTMGRVFKRLSGEQNIRCATLSLDAFYLTHNALKQRQAEFPDNPFFKTRGAPGTHDIQLAVTTLSALRASQKAQVRVPVYYKHAHDGAGDRAPPELWEHISTPLEILLLDGWMLGFRPCTTHHRLSPELQCIDRFLNDYRPLQSCVDVWIVVEPLHVDAVHFWREEQEQVLRRTHQAGMTTEQVQNFVQQFVPLYNTYQNSVKTNFVPGISLSVDRRRRIVSARRTGKTGTVASP